MTNNAMTNGTRASRPQLDENEPNRTAGGTPAHHGWHQRGYLPHCDFPGLIQSIGFRLFDSVPAPLIEAWKREIEHWPTDPAEERLQNPGRHRELLARIDQWADQGHGCCYLADPQLASLVERALLHFDDQRYDLLAWCVMSNHVHVLAVPRVGFSLSDIVQSWKSYTAKEANKRLKRSGPFWAPDYFDEFMKSSDQLAATIEYIENNPVKAGLVLRPSDWTYSSAAALHQPRVAQTRLQFAEIDPEQLPWD